MPLYVIVSRCHFQGTAHTSSHTCEVPRMSPWSTCVLNVTNLIISLSFLNLHLYLPLFLTTTPNILSLIFSGLVVIFQHSFFSIFFFCFYHSLFLSLPFFSVLLLTFLFVCCFFCFFFIVPPPPHSLVFENYSSAISLLIYNFMLSLLLYYCLFLSCHFTLCNSLIFVDFIFLNLYLVNSLLHFNDCYLLSLLFQFFSVLSFLFFLSLNPSFLDVRISSSIFSMSHFCFLSSMFAKRHSCLLYID